MYIIIYIIYAHNIDQLAFPNLLEQITNELVKVMYNDILVLL